MKTRFLLFVAATASAAVVALTVARDPAPAAKSVAGDWHPVLNLTSPPASIIDLYDFSKLTVAANGKATMTGVKREGPERTKKVVTVAGQLGPAVKKGVMKVDLTHEKGAASVYP